MDEMLRAIDRERDRPMTFRLGRSMQMASAITAFDVGLTEPMRREKRYLANFGDRRPVKPEDAKTKKRRQMAKASRRKNRR